MIIEPIMRTIKIYFLRTEGNRPKKIIKHFCDRYEMYAYQGDLIEWQDLHAPARWSVAAWS
ncbi:MAG: DUF5814 domain-containing protein [Methanothrix sp.]|nr:DUF5814 domain-containing protein [Methanothrix sp.]